MKYEAKFANISGKTQDTYKGWRFDSATGNLSITSLAMPEPITQINQTQARTACESLGLNFHLITNAQWTTIARNVEANPLNWDSGIIGTGSIFRGHSDINPNFALNISNTLDYWDQTGENSPSIEKRVLILNNSETIWDFGGNVWEWNNDSCLNSNYNSGGWYEWDRISTPDLSDFEKINAGPLGNLNSSKGIGRYYGCSSNGNGFVRGGSWSAVEISGIFALHLNYNPSASFSSFGFRCSYTP